MRPRDGETAEKLRGAYYTPAPLAHYLARWALAREPARVLEPCCGDGAFLRAIAAHGPARRARAVLDAVELDVRAARAARAHGPALAEAGCVLRVARGDFFAWLAAQPESALWDAVVGNPPYVRYQYLDPAIRDNNYSKRERAGVPLSKRTNAWVPFVVACASRLAPGGRLAMVVPAELLHVLHADGLRRLLEREMSAVTVVHLRAMVFPGVLQGVVLLLATRRRDARPASRADDDDEAAGGLARLRVLDVDDPAALPDPAALDASDEAQAPRAPRAFEGRWMRSLLAPDEVSLLDRVERAPWAPRFDALASVDIGAVTGANGFFVADRATVRAHGFEPIARPMLGRSEHVRGVEYSADDHVRNADGGRAVFFLEFPARDALTAPMRAYLARGEALGLHERYKCRIREPWWAVPYVWPAPVSLLKRSHGYPRLVLNSAAACSTDTAYRVRPRDATRGREAHLVFSFVNSLTLLLAELEGRSYGGGVLELVPSEIERLRVPLAAPNAEQFATLDAMVRAGRDADEVLEFTDALTLGREGPGGLPSRAIATLRGAWRRLRDRRLRVG